MLSQHFFINLHLTGLISRLAIYSQPLLRSFLLDESLIFQPSIRSLFQVTNCSWYLIKLLLSCFYGNFWLQVLRSLKHKIESKLKEISSNQLINLINESESLLLERENKVVNVRKYALLHSIRSTLTSNEDSVTNGRLPEKGNKFQGASKHIFCQPNSENLRPYYYHYYFRYIWESKNILTYPLLPAD